MNRHTLASWLPRLAASAAVLLGIAQWVFQQPSDRQLLLRSIELAAGTALGSTVGGFLLSAGLRRMPAQLQQITLNVLLALLLIPLYIHFCAWDAAGGKLGWVTVLFRSPANPLLRGLYGATVIHIAAAIPLVTLWLFYVAAPNTLANQAAALEGPGWMTFLRLRLPQILPVCLAAAAWIFLQTLGEMTITNIYLVKTYIEEVYNSLAGNIDTREALTGVLPLTAWVGMTLLMTLAITPQILRPIFTSSARQTVQLDRSKPSWPITALTILAIGMLVAIPTVSFLMKIGSDVQQSATGLIRNWSLSKATGILTRTPGYFSTEIQISAYIGLVASWVGLLISMLAGHQLLRPQNRPLKFQPLWPQLLLIGIATIPGPVIGLLLIEAFGNSPWPLFHWLHDRTIAITALAQGLKCVPVQGLLVAVLFLRIPTATLEASQLEFGRPWLNRLRLVLSECKAGLIATWLVGFLIACGDLSFSQLVVPPGLETLPRRIFGLAHSGIDEQLAGMGLWILFLTIFSLAILQKLWNARSSPSPQSRN